MTSGPQFGLKESYLCTVDRPAHRFASPRLRTEMRRSSPDVSDTHLPTTADKSNRPAMSADFFNEFLCRDQDGWSLFESLLLLNAHGFPQVLA